jgi:hypothetical protein
MYLLDYNGKDTVNYNEDNKLRSDFGTGSENWLFPACPLGVTIEELNIPTPILFRPMGG